jgi:hypothetical protein
MISENGLDLGSYGLDSVDDLAVIKEMIFGVSDEVAEQRVRVLSTCLPTCL